MGSDHFEFRSKEAATGLHVVKREILCKEPIGLYSSLMEPNLTIWTNGLVSSILVLCS